MKSPATVPPVAVPERIFWWGVEGKGERDRNSLERRKCEWKMLVSTVALFVATKDCVCVKEVLRVLTARWEETGRGKREGGGRARQHTHTHSLSLSLSDTHRHLSTLGATGRCGDAGNTEIQSHLAHDYRREGLLLDDVSDTRLVQHSRRVVAVGHGLQHDDVQHKYEQANMTVFTGKRDSLS